MSDNKMNCNNCGFEMLTTKYISGNDIVVNHVCGKCKCDTEYVYKNVITEKLINNTWKSPKLNVKL